VIATWSCSGARAGDRMMADRIMGGRVACAGLIALLAWGVAKPAASPAHRRGAPATLATGSRSTLASLASAADEVGPRTSRAYWRAPATLARVRHDAPARGAGTGHDRALDALRAEQLARLTRTSRVWLCLRSKRCLPSAEPSPYDATAPPSAAQRSV